MTPYLPDDQPSAKKREQIELEKWTASKQFESEFRKKHPGLFTLFGQDGGNGEESNSSSNGTNTSEGANKDGDYPVPLTKEILLNYVKKSCPNCTDGQLQDKTGDVFEDLFENYIDGFTFSGYTVQKNPLNKVHGDMGASIPDFFGFNVSGKGIVPDKIELYSFYELKATKNNIGLSTFENQLKIQITAAKAMGVKELIMVTTSDIRLTAPLRNYAATNGVQITHQEALYTMSGGSMKLDFRQVKY